MSAPSTCPACRAAEAFVEGACKRCGYATGEKNRCPHCKVVARIDGTGTAAVCAQCGGPRVVANYGGEAAVSALREQQVWLAIARVRSVATVFQGLLAAAVTAVGLLLRPDSIVGKALVIAFAVLPLLLAFRSRSRAQVARSNAKSASDRAWQAAAEDVAAHTPTGVTAAALATTLGLDAAHADQLLTTLTVHDRARIDVGDDAEVRYSSTHELRDLPSADSEDVASDRGAGESERTRLR